MATVLVTGGAGYIGSHTCVQFLAAQHQVVVIDNFSNSSPKALERVAQIAGVDLWWQPVPKAQSKPISTLSKAVMVCYQADLRDRQALAAIFQQHHFDWVIHFAGLKAVGASVATPLTYYEHNVVGTLALLETMQQYGCKNIVFSSSATVYGQPEQLPLTETCRLAPTNPYGRTKLMIEQILADVAAADPAFCAVILRYFNPIGAHASGKLGEIPCGVPNNLTPYIAQVLTGQRAALQIFGNDYPTPDGTGVRDYLHVEDLAAGHLCALARVQQPGVHLYNLGTGRGYSVLDVVHAFERVTGKKVPYQIQPRRAGDVAACYADATKARQALGWQAKYDLDAMCASLWQFYTQNPHGYE